jgi:hypothetical protein
MLPICAAFLIDLSLDTLPLITIAALLVFLPLGAIWLSRVSLREFDRIVAEVAPDDDVFDEDDIPDDESGVRQSVGDPG